MSDILPRTIPRHQQQLNEAIDSAYRCGDNAAVDAPLIAEQALIHCGPGGHQPTPVWSPKAVA